jgi:hypothetical protein
MAVKALLSLPPICSATGGDNPSIFNLSAGILKRLRLYHRFRPSEPTLEAIIRELLEE